MPAACRPCTHAWRRPHTGLPPPQTPYRPGLRPMVHYPADLLAWPPPSGPRRFHIIYIYTCRQLSVHPRTPHGATTWVSIIHYHPSSSHDHDEGYLGGLGLEDGHLREFAATPSSPLCHDEVTPTMMRAMRMVCVFVGCLTNKH